MDENKVFDIVKQTAFNVQSIGEQMGMITTEVKTLKGDIRKINSDIGDLAGRMQHYEDTKFVTRQQRGRLKGAIHKRVRELLGIRYDENGNVLDECIYDDVNYRFKFIQRCYRDARAYGKLGNPLEETYAKDYLESLDYINGWAPIEGVTGLKMYFDKRKEAKS